MQALQAPDHGTEGEAPPGEGYGRCTAPPRRYIRHGGAPPDGIARAALAALLLALAAGFAAVLHPAGDSLGGVRVQLAVAAAAVALTLAALPPPRRRGRPLLALGAALGVLPGQAPRGRWRRTAGRGSCPTGRT